MQSNMQSSKCFVGSGKIHLAGDLDHKKVLRGLKDAFKGPQTAHFDLTWSRFGALFQSLRAVLTSSPSQISFAQLSSQFVSRGSLFKSHDPTSEHNLDITDRHLECIVREHVIHCSADVPAVKVATHKSHGHTYTYVQAMDGESLTINRVPNATIKMVSVLTCSTI